MVVVLVSTAAGVIMAVLLSLPGMLRLRARLREATQRFAELEQRLRERDSTSADRTP